MHHNFAESWKYDLCGVSTSKYAWEKHPIVHIDFSQIPNKTPEALEEGLKETLMDIAEFYDVSLAGTSAQSLLKRLIQSLSKQGKVVVLIDEYDQPLISHLDNLEVAEKNRDFLKEIPHKCYFQILDEILRENRLLRKE